MKKSDLKNLIKPLVKECINEVLIEEGLLSNIVAEVAQGLQTNLVTETREHRQPTQNSHHAQSEQRQKLIAHKKKLMDSIGEDAYNGVNLFENTEPMTGQEAAGTRQGAPDLGSPRDAGVDISSLVGNASKVWDAIK
tara:strand:- start:1283 stop:1693 length:411 start_codon:yes stop_codon:yes gene_type:complete